MLVTGATGFLGSCTVRALVGLGFQVMATGRDLSKAPSPHASVEFVAADLSDPASMANLQAAVGTLDAVVHAAALSAPWGTRAAFHAANVTATSNVIDLARNSGARRLVYISTPSVYFRFEDQLGVRETVSLPTPVNMYARTKRLAEELVLSADLDIFILRPRALYGMGDSTMLPRLIHAAKTRRLPLMRGGRAVTDLTHVDDAADAIVAALQARASAAGIYNISGGEPVQLTEIIERVCDRLGVRVTWRPTSFRAALGAAQAWERACSLVPWRPEPTVTAYAIGVLAFSQTLNIEAAIDRLAWTPKVGFDEGLNRTLGTSTIGR